jgi:hypothetical protein
MAQCLLSALVILGSTVIGVGTAAQRPIAQEGAAFRDIADASSRIRLFDVWYEVTWSGFLTHKDGDPTGESGLRRLEPPKVTCHRYRMRYAGIRVRLDEFSRSSTGEWSEDPVMTRLEEGLTKELTHEPANRLLCISHAGIMLYRQGSDYRCPWLNAFGNYSVPWLLSQRKAVSESRETIDGKNFVVLFSPGGEGESTFPLFRFKIYLDPAVTLLPFKAIVFRAMHGGFVLDTEAQVTRWRVLDMGEKVPVAIKTTVYSKAPGSVGEPLSVMELVVDEQRSTWNQALPPDSLSLNVPDGTRVEDQIKNVTYTKGEPDAAKRLDLLAELANKQAPLRSETLIAAAPWWQSTPAIIAYVVLALALVYIIIRRRRLAAE